ncbi:phasin family protein [Methylobacterium nonmethylotrophicum]|uniref:Phasin family protein n=1 Tax=Methylobacterium nonmethylotrophicum TaxID=1141884 RepID=A0A4Z0NRJ8_9HYPH|nr:phasin family protein [Methylobacterium nonmethylotrophicum]
MNQNISHQVEKQAEAAQKFGKDGMDAMLRSFGTLSKASQAIAVEATDFAKQSFEHGTATLEKLAGVRSLDKALEIQTEYMKTSYERLVAQTTKMTELYQNLAKEMAKPFEGLVAQAQDQFAKAQDRAFKVVKDGVTKVEDEAGKAYDAAKDAA